VITLSCAKPHPVQPTPTTWPVPEGFKTCKVLETVRWPDNGWMVRLHCPEGFRLVDFHTGESVEFASAQIHQVDRITLSCSSPSPLFSVV
jgi:hypothetical protein